MAENKMAQGSKHGEGPVQLSHTDRSLLLQFVEGGGRGVPTSQIGLVLGKRGKAIARAGEAWGRALAWSLKRALQLSSRQKPREVEDSGW